MSLPSPISKLEKALIAGIADPDQRSKFYDELLKSFVYFIALNTQNQSTKYMHEKEITSEHPQNLELPAIEISGKQYTPFFSSIDRLVESINAQVNYTKMYAVDFFKLFANNTRHLPLILNPSSNPAKEFSQEEIDLLADNINPAENRATSPMQLNAGEEIFLGQPKRHPFELIRALKEGFSKIPTIKKAYNIQVCNKSRNEKPHTMIFIDANGKLNDIIEKVTALLATIKEIPEPPVDIAELKTNIRDPFSRYCQTIEPFFTQEPSPKS